ncbi:hypothetical protein [Paenibacillus terrae]|nr:hypothetical protein [Paenibacillus terrae]
MEPLRSQMMFPSLLSPDFLNERYCTIQPTPFLCEFFEFSVDLDKTAAV